ncbi:MAG TPA: ABC transporter permease [Thermodesulfovibrionales bacterium]|nr:ABC transporter permease [Thermodesulfovibrionales bacterium]
MRYLPVFSVVVIWQVLSLSGVIPGNRLPSPVNIFLGFTELLTQGLPPGYGLAGHCAGSLKRVLGGVGVAIVTALPLGIAMGYWSRAREYLNPFVEMVRPVPPLAWVPIAILWFGIGDRSSSFVIFLGAFFPVLLNTIAGVLSINRRLIESSIILGASKKALFGKVLLPGAMPSIITGVRIALGIGWMTLVAAEFTGVKSGYGLGYMIMTARDIQRPDQIIAGMAIIGIIGYAMDFGIRIMENKILKWR